MAGKFEVYQDKAGKYRWSLKARNGQVVASGQGYDTKAAAIRGTQAVQRAAEGATLLDPDPQTSAEKAAEEGRQSRAWPKKYTSPPYRKSGSGTPRAEKATATKGAAREKSVPKETAKKPKARKLIKIEETGASHRTPSLTLGPDEASPIGQRCAG